MDLGQVAFGVFSVGGDAPRVGALVAGGVVDMAATHGGMFAAPTLNPLLAAGPAAWARAIDSALAAPPTHAPPGVKMHIPIEVADYVDFYSSRVHAENAGRILRPGTDPLPAQWLDMPIGYHGRAGTVVVSGTPIVRPCGQLGPASFGPTAKLDIEAEVGWVIGVPAPGPIPASSWRDHVFGAVLVNDWSARDIQAYEARPLGPFLGKSFATSISAWVTPLPALDDLRVAGPAYERVVRPYLAIDEPRGYDLDLEVAINGDAVSRPPFRHMYWSPGQQLAHMTVNGASVRTGDLFASGTVSGPSDPGSLLELSDDTRYLADGDEVVISCPRLAPVAGRVVAARPPA